MASAGLALLVANARYWSTVAPIVRGELRRWERRAEAIEDPELRTLALEKLRGESFHAEAAAMLATLAPRAHRSDAVRAIVALELLFDYLDGLTERATADPLRDGARLFEAYVEAVTVGGGVHGSCSGSNREHRRSTPDDAVPNRRDANDGGYLEALSAAARAALTRLPAAGTVTGVAQISAARSAQAQVRMHAAAALGAGQLEHWARAEADGTGLEWRELLAGAASSVLAAHALIAAAADPRTTVEQAEELERAYLCTCVLLTLLDGLVDHESDVHTENAHAGGLGTGALASPGHGTNRLGSDGQGTDGRGRGGIGSGGLGYIGLYPDRDELSQTLTVAATRAARRARALRDGPHHAMTLVGVVAYYTSAPGARSELAAPIAKRLQLQFAPLILPTLAFMRAWRLAKRVRNRRVPTIEGLGSTHRGITKRGRAQ